MKEKSSEEHMPSPLLMDSNNPSTEMKDNLSNEYILSSPGIESHKPSAKIQHNSSEKHISSPAIKKSSDPEREAKEILSRKHISSPPIDQSHDHPEKIMGNISPEKHILSHPITESAVPKGEEKSQKEYVVASDHSITDTKNISPDQHIYSPPKMDFNNPSTEMKDNLSNEYTLSPPGIEPHKPSSEIQDNSSEKHISSPVIAESKDLLTNTKNNSHENNVVSSPIIKSHDPNEEMKGNLYENISPSIKEAHNLKGENNSTEKHNLSQPITESDAFKKEMKVKSQEEHVSMDESHTSITTKNKTDLQQLHVASPPIDETHHPGTEGKDNSESKTQVYPNPEMSISDTLPKEISQPEQKEKPHYQIEADTEIKANTPESKISVPKDNFESTKPLPQKGKTEAYGKIENEEGKQFLENMESNNEEEKLMGSSESGDQHLVNPKLETTKSKDATDLSKEPIKPGIDGKPIFSLLSRPSNENVVIHTPAFAQHNSSEDLVEQALYHPESGSGSPRNIEEDKTQLSSHKPSPINDPKMKQNLIKESSKFNATNKDKTVIDPNPTNVSDKEIPATESADKTLSKFIPRRDEVSDPTTQIVPERGANETTLANPKTAPKKIDTPTSDQIPTSSIPREEFSGISAITQKDIGSSENLPVYLPIPPQDPSSFFDPNQFASTISPIMNPHTGQIGDNSGQISETERDLFELNEKIKSRRGKIDSSNKPTGKSTSSKESKMTSKEEKKKATKNSKLTQKGYSQTNPTTSGPTYAHRGPQPFDDSGSEIIDMDGQVIESETEFQNNPIPSFGREQVKQADPGLEEYIKTSQPQSSKKSKISPSHNVDTSVLGMESIEDLAREIANNMDRNSESLESKSKMSKPQSSDSSIEKGFGIIMDPSQLISPNYEENFGDDALKRPQYRTSNPELKQSSLPLTPIEERIESSPYFQSSNKKILDDEMEMGSPEPVRESHYASQALKSIQEKEREMKIRKAQQANRIGGSMGNSPGHLPFEIQSKFGQSKRAGNIPIEEPFSLYQIGSGSLRHRHTNTVGFSDAPRPILPEVEFSRISKRDSNIDLTVTDFFDTTKRNVPARPSHFRKQSVGSMPARMPPAIRSRSSVQVNLEGRSRIYIGEEITKKKPIVIVPELQSSKDMAELGRALDSAISLSKKKAKEIKKNKPSRFSRKPAKVEPQALKTGKSSRPTPIKKPIKKPEPLSKSTAKNPKNSLEMSQTSRTPVKTTPRTKKRDSLQLSPMEELKETPKSLKKGKQLAQRPPRDISSSQAKCEKSGFFKNSLCGQSAGMGGDSFNADFMQELGWAHSGTKQVLRSDSMKQGEEEIKSYPLLVAQTEEPKQEDSLEEQPEEYSPESSRIIPSDNLHLLKEAQKAIEKHTYDSPDVSTFRLTRRLGSPRFDSMTFEPLQQSMEQFGEPPANQTVSRSVARPKMANRTVLDPKAGLSGYSDTKSAKSWEKHVRGMKNHGNTNHLNAILQCLFALPCLVQGYLSPLHESWTSTKYNRCLRTFFQGYRKGFGPYDPLPFITSALINKNEEYNVFRVHDPYDTLKRIFFNMLKAQKIVAIKKKNLSETTDISTAETYLGSLVTSIIQNKATCKVCGKSTHQGSRRCAFR